MSGATRLNIASAIDWQPEDPQTLANPFPLLARLREEDPCHWPKEP